MPRTLKVGAREFIEAEIKAYQEEQLFINDTELCDRQASAVSKHILKRASEFRITNIEEDFLDKHQQHKIKLAIKFAFIHWLDCYLDSVDLRCESISGRTNTGLPYITAFQLREREISVRSNFPFLPIKYGPNPAINKAKYLASRIALNNRQFKYFCRKIDVLAIDWPIQEDLTEEQERQIRDYFPDCATYARMWMKKNTPQRKALRRQMGSELGRLFKAYGIIAGKPISISDKDLIDRALIYLLVKYQTEQEITNTYLHYGFDPEPAEPIVLSLKRFPFATGQRVLPILT